MFSRSCVYGSTLVSRLVKPWQARSRYLQVLALASNGEVVSLGRVKSQATSGRDSLDMLRAR
jgi:hypothetical protein